jgi:hypothetical protein
MISAISNQGHLKFMFIDGSFNSEVFHKWHPGGSEYSGRSPWVGYREGNASGVIEFSPQEPLPGFFLFSAFFESGISKKHNSLTFNA